MQLQSGISAAAAGAGRGICSEGWRLFGIAKIYNSIDAKKPRSFYVAFTTYVELSTITFEPLVIPRIAPLQCCASP